MLALQILASKGVRPLYLTARPEWLTQRSRDFLTQRGFPAGIVHTTLSKLGALGGAAETYKTNELSALASKGLAPLYAFGNTESDGVAYANAGVEPVGHRVFFKFDDPHGGRRIEDYGELLGELNALSSCLP